MASIIHLDTHVVVWLKAAQSRLSEAARQRINENDCLISPVVQLELQFLHEIGRLKLKATSLIDELHTEMGLGLDTTPFEQVIKSALDMNWTRDPFDRLIGAQARTAGVALLTRDVTLREHLPFAVWE